MAFELPKLQYAVDALEPYIDAQTMTIHHDKHHAAYITNLNGALEKYPELASKSLEGLLAELNGVPEDVRTVVRNHGGGTWNHSMFWEIMAPKAGGACRRSAHGNWPCCRSGTTPPKRSSRARHSQTSSRSAGNTPRHCKTA